MTGVPSRVGVIGGGRMGAGIAHAFLLAGSSVTLLERNAEAAAQALEALSTAVDVSITRGTSSESRADLLARFVSTLEAEELAESGLVVEAVPEDFALKAEMLAKIEAVVSNDTWLSSNTSSLSISSIAEVLTRPERFCGLHFFNPVPSSTLVEIVRGEKSAGELIERAKEWVVAIGKTPVTVNDSPGFASSRLGVVIALEAIRMLQEGVASSDDIDAAMVLGYKFPVGPLRLTDMVGLDVRLGIANYLHSELGERFEPPILLRTMVEEGKLGRKSGEGFYRWDD
jgi:3-hydroxybutyryl-CoA dehydrogenase